MKRFFSLLFAFQLTISSHAQIDEYLNRNKVCLDKEEFQFNTDFYSNDVFFFGFIHGSATPQELDFRLLKHLHEHGIRYYAPEVDPSLAFFLNKYLKSGDNELLRFISFHYRQHVPQDASLQFEEKWKKIYQFNKQLPDDEKITILGFDYPRLKELVLTHLAFLTDDAVSDPLADSLKQYRNYDFNEYYVRSGKPYILSGKEPDYFFPSAKTEMYNRIKTEYQDDPKKILSLFGSDSVMVNKLLAQPTTREREAIIFHNFREECEPLLGNGGKIYCNYGYTHVFQEKINGYDYFAKRVKDSGVKTVSVLGLLQNSNCLKHIQNKKTEKRKIKGYTFQMMEYSGYKTSKRDDGDSFFERVEGMKELRKAAGHDQVVLFNLTAAGSPFRKELCFAKMKRGGKYWRVEKDAVTTDYIQYVILISGSKANISFLEN